MVPETRLLLVHLMRPRSFFFDFRPMTFHLCRAVACCDSGGGTAVICSAVARCAVLQATTAKADTRWGRHDNSDLRLLILAVMYERASHMPRASALAPFASQGCSFQWCVAICYIFLLCVCS